VFVEKVSNISREAGCDKVLLPGLRLLRKAGGLAGVKRLLMSNNKIT
jgi:hypothetical protein